MPPRPTTALGPTHPTRTSENVSFPRQTPVLLRVLETNLSLLESARSDSLATVRRLLESSPHLQAVLGLLEQRAFVIDSNRVLQDVAWLARRRNPAARTQLQELCASGTVSLFAPDLLIDQVEAHLPEVAERLRIPVERAREQWRSYSQIIRFVPAGHLRPVRQDCSRDPTDAPFLAAQDAVGAMAIISKDKDLSAMGALLVQHEAVVALIDFVRAMSAATAGKLTGAMVLMAVGATGWGLWSLGVHLWKSFCRLPNWLRIALPFGLVALLVHPRARAKAREVVQSIKPQLDDLRSRAGEGISQFLTELQAYENKASAALDAMRRHLPPPARSPALRQLAYRACLEADAPLRPEEIESRIRTHGFRSRAKKLQPYLRRVLRRDERLVRLGDAWTLRYRVARIGNTVDIA